MTVYSVVIMVHCDEDYIWGPYHVIIKEMGLLIVGEEGVQELGSDPK